MEGAAVAERADAKFWAKGREPGTFKLEDHEVQSASIAQSMRFEQDANTVVLGVFETRRLGVGNDPLHPHVIADVQHDHGCRRSCGHADVQQRFVEVHVERRRKQWFGGGVVVGDGWGEAAGDEQNGEGWTKKTPHEFTARSRIFPGLEDVWLADPAVVAQVEIPFFPILIPTTLKSWEAQWESMEATVDERGRILIPKKLRDKFHLAPGSVVDVEEHDGHMQIVVDRRKAQVEHFRKLVGMLNSKTRRTDVSPMDPLDLKKIWEPRL